MPATVFSLAEDALELPPEQRLDLVRLLLDSIDVTSDPGAEAAWSAEIQRRLAKYRSGGVETLSEAEVFGSLREDAPDH